MQGTHLFWKPYSAFSTRERIVCRGFVELLDLGSFNLALAPFYVLPFLCFARQAWSAVERGVVAWCLVELLFRMYVHLRVYGMERHRPEPMEHEPMALARRVARQMGDPTQLLHWFPPGEPHSRAGLEFLLARIFFEKEDLSEDEKRMASQLAEMFACGLPERPFFSRELLWPSARPVKYKVRSILGYGMMATIRAMGSLKLRSLGFVWHDLPTGLGYWIYRPAPSRQPPILYFHGIGYGLTQMLPQIISLVDSHPHRVIVLFNLPQISFTAFAPVASELDILAAVDTLFRREQLARVSAVGHSFGTLVCMWLAMRRPAYLAQLTLVDPVCFMLWDACLVNRACHATPTTMVHHAVRRIISRDPNFALAISRYMYWLCSFEVCDEFPCPTRIFLAKRDWVIDAPATFNYLHERKCRLRQDNVAIHMNDIDHLQFMFTPKLLRQINCAA